MPATSSHTRCGRRACTRRNSARESTSSPRPMMLPARCENSSTASGRKRSRNASRSSIAGVAPENSSSAPARKRERAGDLRHDRRDVHARRARWARASGCALRGQLLGAEQQRAEHQRHQVVDARGRRAASRAAHPTARPGSVSSMTASNTPTPPGTWLTMPAITASGVGAEERHEADVRVRRQQRPQHRRRQRQVAAPTARAARGRCAAPAARSAQPRISSVPRAERRPQRVGGHRARAARVPTSIDQL